MWQGTPTKNLPSLQRLSISEKYQQSTASGSNISNGSSKPNSQLEILHPHSDKDKFTARNSDIYTDINTGKDIITDIDTDINKEASQYR